MIAGEGLNAITWMAAARDLVVGTIKEEFVISSPDGKALSNTNITILNQTAYGSKRATVGYPCEGLQGELTPSPQLKGIVVTVQFVIPALNTRCGGTSG
jgi:hypothetical protein